MKTITNDFATFVGQREHRRAHVRTINQEPSLTDQSQSDQCDVNNIIAQYTKTGQINHLNKRQGQYADLSGVEDLLHATKTVSDAQSAFNELPSHLRKRFENDPKQLLEFVHNPKNYDEAIELGLVPRPQNLGSEVLVPTEPKAKPREPKTPAKNTDSE